MKKKLFLLLGIFFLSSCNFITIDSDNRISSSFSSGEIVFSSENESSISSDLTENPKDYKTIILDGTFSSSETYSTVFTYKTISSVTYQYYRVKNDSNYFVTLQPKLPYYEYVDESSAGSFSNYDAILDIDEISITYSTSQTTGEGSLFYGEDLKFKKKHSIQYSTVEKKVSFDVSNVNTNFFKIQAGEGALYIKKIEIKYTGEGEESDVGLSSSGEGKYRLNPVVYSGELVSGKSYVEMPIEVEVDGSSYKVTKYKKYTYYSVDDVASNTSLASKATYIDPIDVANYFIAFNTWPCNFYPKTGISKPSSISSIYEQKEIFGDDTRYVSMYSRTDGYAQYVPYATDFSGKVKYYELDIDLDGNYLPNSRDVGRVVVWAYGYSSTNKAGSLNNCGIDYDSSPVAVFTDDHYLTFQEYYNNGTFSHRYNCEVSGAHLRITGYEYGAPVTLN